MCDSIYMARVAYVSEDVMDEIIHRGFFDAYAERMFASLGQGNEWLQTNGFKPLVIDGSALLSSRAFVDPRSRTVFQPQFTTINVKGESNVRLHNIDVRHASSVAR